MMRLIVLLPTLLVAACATAPAPERTAPQTRAQALAALLVETESIDPARVEAASEEMAALERALIAHSEPAPTESQATLAPPPDLSSARSVMSAVHLASYRERRHAVSGWAELSARHAALSGLSARLSQADLGERGVFLRLKAGPFDTPGAAEAACNAIKASGEWCAVTAFAGDAL